MLSDFRITTVSVFMRLAIIPSRISPKKPRFNNVNTIPVSILSSVYKRGKSINSRPLKDREEIKSHGSSFIGQKKRVAIATLKYNVFWN